MSDLYKVLVNHQSAHGGILTWSLPTPDGDDWQPGQWHRIPSGQQVDICHVGLHLTSDPTQWLKTGCEVYLAEGRGEHQSRDDKTAFAEARLLRPAPEMIPEWWRKHERFVAELPRIPWCQPDGDPNPEWRVFTAPTLAMARGAARDAAYGAAYAAAYVAARDAASGAASGAAYAAASGAARDAAYDAASGAARGAARDAARGAASVAASGAARDAARVAALYTDVQHICDGLPVKQRHRDYVEAAWEVWRKGWCLLGDVNGVLYVYAKDGQS